METVGRHALCGEFSFVVADDHPSVSLAVSQICQSWLGVDAGRFVMAHCSHTLLEVCSKPSPLPRIIVLDLVMPGDLKRAALVRAVRREDPQARVLVYSADESAFLAKSVMSAGANAYVSKSSPTSELVDAIVAVSEGRAHIDARIDFRTLRESPWASLTESERAILLAFCRGDKPDAIMASTGRSYSTVTTHKYNGLKKIGLNDGNELLPYLYANGLICELDDDGIRSE